MTCWGPQRRRAAVSVTFETLGDGSVSPALPTVLQALAERELSATFFVDAAVAKTDPLALTMIASARSETAALVHSPSDLPPALAAVGRPGRPPGGVRAVTVSALPPAAELGRASLRYASAPGDTIRLGAGVVRIPFDAALREGARDHPAAWHEALQVAIARAVQEGGHLTITAFPAALERGDALAVLVETLDLVAGLRRAQRLWTPTLDELATFWLDTSNGHEEEDQ